MKTMTCRQLGGAGDLAFRANTFDEMAEMSKKHGMEMFQKGDADHLKAMEEMKIRRLPETRRTSHGESDRDKCARPEPKALGKPTNDRRHAREYADSSNSGTTPGKNALAPDASSAAECYITGRRQKDFWGLGARTPDHP